MMGLKGIDILPLVGVIAAIAAPGAAQAGCSISGKVETCSGTVTGAIVHRQNDVHTLTASGLDKTVDAAASSDTAKQVGPVIDLADPGGVTPEPSDWNSKNRNGQTGIDGAAGSSLGATISLDAGYGLKGQSGIRLQSTGWDGSGGHEAHHTDAFAKGGKGGVGGKAGDVTLTAAVGGGGKPAAAISASGGDSASTGITLTSTGGSGGGGGWAESSGGLRNAEGGAGGQGGAAGKITVQLQDGHALDYSGAGVGLVATAQGGHGGTGGYGEVTGLDADSSQGGMGGMAPMAG